MRDNKYDPHDPRTIARVCHEANRGLQYEQGDPAPSEPWDATPIWVKQLTVNAVVLYQRGYTNEEIHNEWCKRHYDNRWTYGPVKDYLKKTHPCLVGYYELPENQRHKNELMHVITVRLSSF